MPSKLTKHQRNDLTGSHGQPVPVEDEEGRKVYCLVDADYLHTSHEQLKALIQAGIKSNYVPSDEAEGELRRYADRLASRPP